MSAHSPEHIVALMGHHFTVLPEEGRLVWKTPPKHHPRLAGKDAGRASVSQSGKPYIQIKLDGRVYRRSHLIFLWVHRRFPRPLVDHIDGNSVNDRAANLREATATQNAWNHKFRRKAAALPMGIRRLPSGRFQARIACNGRKISIGVLDSEQAAQTAYAAARTELFGEFA